MDEDNSSAIVRPITSSPLSAESRQAMFSRATISSAAFRGNNDLISARKDNEETLSAIQSNQQTLSGIQQEIVSLRQEIGSLNPGLIRIASLIERDTLSDEQATREQQERERRLAEQNIRLGKEDELENRIQNAIVAPVQRLTPKVENLFGGVGAALAALFGGWLVNQTIEYMKAEGQKNTDRLVEIKNNILRNIGIAGGILVSIRSGFSLFTNILKGVTSKIASLLGKIIAAPFKGAAAAASSVKNILTGKKPGATPPKTTAPPKPSGLLGGAKNFIRGLGMPLLTGGALTALDTATTGEDPGRAAAGAAGGMVSSAVVGGAASLLPIPGSGLFGGFLAYGPGEQFGKGLYDNIFGKPESTQTNQNKQTNQTSTPSQAQVNPQIPKIDNKQPEFNSTSSSVLSTPVNLNSYERSKSDVMMQSPETITTSDSQLKPPSAVVSPTQTPQTIQNKTESVGPLPEPKPTVVMTPPKPEKQPTQSPMNVGSVADVPLIPSANPDNFYSLYSQMHYNVVV